MEASYSSETFVNLTGLHCHNLEDSELYSHRLVNSDLVFCQYAVKVLDIIFSALWQIIHETNVGTDRLVCTERLPEWCTGNERMWAWLKDSLPQLQLIFHNKCCNFLRFMLLLW
jgi:hypothetical protein